LHPEPTLARRLGGIANSAKHYKFRLTLQMPPSKAELQIPPNTTNAAKQGDGAQHRGAGE